MKNGQQKSIYMNQEYRQHLLQKNKSQNTLLFKQSNFQNNYLIANINCNKQSNKKILNLHHHTYTNSIEKPIIKQKNQKKSWCKYVKDNHKQDKNITKSKYYEIFCSSTNIVKSNYLLAEENINIMKKYQPKSSCQDLISVSRQKQQLNNSLSKTRKTHKKGISILSKKEQFLKNKNLRLYLVKSSEKYQKEQDVTSIRQHIIEKVEKKQSNNKNQNFKIIRLIGRGGFAQIYLIELYFNKKKYALKIFTKQSDEIQTYIQSQKKILTQIDHPFIVKAYNLSFKLPYNSIVLQYFSGGDLAQHLKYYKSFPENISKIMIGQVILAIQYLHKKNIIYRDLKPQNIVLDESGHLHLTDFGLSKYIQQKTFSFCGSFNYLAPQMICHQNGYNKSMDWYHIGILLYQITIGQPPFCGISQIQNKQVVIPRKYSKQFGQLIIKLLQKDPKKRLGNNGCQEIKNMNFFKELIWQKIEKKGYRLPIPHILNSFENKMN